MDDINPLGIFLVKSGSKGDRLLFRYPFSDCQPQSSDKKRKKRNPYALSEDIQNRQDGHFPDKVLANLLAVKNDLGNQKFEMKVNDVRFVGHPILLNQDSNCRLSWTANSPLREQTTKSTLNLFSIVFALRTNAGHSVVNCYHEFSHRLVVCLKHEEKRCNYLSTEAKVMTIAHDEVNALPEDCELSPFEMILDKSHLARDLKAIFDDLTEKGEVHLKINRWIGVSFCLPHKVHRFHGHNRVSLMPEAIQRCLTTLRPYHGVLLMDSKKALLDTLPLDASPALTRFICIMTPSKCLQTLAADTDLTLTQVFQLVGHLLYWAKAMVIYPLCETNVYMLSPHAPTHITSPLMASFTENFPGVSLLAIMSDFSLPTSLSEWNSPSKIQYQSQYVHIIVWMLQHRLLIQLHTYIYLVASKSAPAIQIAKLQSESDNGSATSDDLSENFNQRHVKLSESTESNLTSPTDDVDTPTYKKLGNSLLSEINPADREAILSIPAASSQEDLTNFLRLLPYFNGKNHMEEIMYYENVRRSRVVAVLDKFRDILITCQHEDVAVASFFCKCIIHPLSFFT